MPGPSGKSMTQMLQAASRGDVQAAASLLPLVYGVGTALPVILVAILLAYSAEHVSKAYNAIAKTEWWARMITGWIFVLLGAWFSLKYVFEIG